MDKKEQSFDRADDLNDEQEDNKNLRRDDPDWTFVNNDPTRIVTICTKVDNMNKKVEKSSLKTLKAGSLVHLCDETGEVVSERPLLILKDVPIEDDILSDNDQETEVNWGNAPGVASVETSESRNGNGTSYNMDGAGGAATMTYDAPQGLVVHVNTDMDEPPDEKEEALVFPENRYTWMKVKIPFKITTKRGTKAELKKGDKIGIREATSSKDTYRIVTKQLGPGVVFSVNKGMLTRIKRKLVK